MRQDVYRTAFEEANTELTEILARFDQLRQRKERIEKVVEMLRPMAGGGGGSEKMQIGSSFDMPEIPTESVSAPVVAEVATMNIREDVGEPVEAGQRTMEQSSDPFQRRIDSALGLGLGSRERDSREFGRRFNGSAHRG